MSRVSFGSHPFLLGFDQLDRLVERTSKVGNDGYPPYNIEQLDEHAYRITLAVAGFSADDLKITMEERQLLIEGGTTLDEGARVYLHRGIATRQFKRSFVLADGMEVASADMENGLLHIELFRTPPEKSVKSIEIKTA